MSLLFILTFAADGAQLHQQRVQRLTVKFTELHAGDTAVQAESVHLVPIGRINAQQLHLVKYRGTLLAENLPKFFLVSGRHQLTHPGYSRTVFLQCHVAQARGTSVRVLGNYAFLQGIAIGCRKAVQKAVKRCIIIGLA